MALITGSMVFLRTICLPLIPLLHEWDWCGRCGCYIDGHHGSFCEQRYQMHCPNQCSGRGERPLPQGVLPTMAPHLWAPLQSAENFC